MIRTVYEGDMELVRWDAGDYTLKKKYEIITLTGEEAEWLKGQIY